MKKVTLLAATVAAMGLASCTTAQAPKANLKTSIDTLSYAAGIAQTNGLKEYAIGRMGVDSADIDEFVKGIQDGVNKTTKQDIAYMAGLQIGQQINNYMLPGLNREFFGNDSTISVSKENFMAGFIAAVTNEKTMMTVDSANVYFRNKAEELHNKRLESKYADNKAAGEKFLAENKGKEGVITTPSGLQYKIEKKGNGEIPGKTSKVKVNYRGTLIDGTEFDSSYKRNQPTELSLNQVIPGWTEAISMMPVGSKWTLYIPQELGYGSREASTIKPFSTLIFEVELLSIEK